MSYPSYHTIFTMTISRGLSYACQTSCWDDEWLNQYFDRKINRYSISYINDILPKRVRYQLLLTKFFLQILVIHDQSFLEIFRHMLWCIRNYPYPQPYWIMSTNWFRYLEFSELLSIILPDTFWVMLSINSMVKKMMQKLVYIK